jgi:hypothetical protein
VMENVQPDQAGVEILISSFVFLLFHAVPYFVIETRYSRNASFRQLRRVPRARIWRDLSRKEDAGSESATLDSVQRRTVHVAG